MVVDCDVTVWVRNILKDLIVYYLSLYECSCSGRQLWYVAIFERVSVIICVTWARDTFGLEIANRQYLYMKVMMWSFRQLRVVIGPIVGLLIVWPSYMYLSGEGARVRCYDLLLAHAVHASMSRGDGLMIVTAGNESCMDIMSRIDGGA